MRFASFFLLAGFAAGQIQTCCYPDGFCGKSTDVNCGKYRGATWDDVGGVTCSAAGGCAPQTFSGGVKGAYTIGFDAANVVLADNTRIVIGSYSSETIFNLPSFPVNWTDGDAVGFTLTRDAFDETPTDAAFGNGQYVTVSLNGTGEFNTSTTVIDLYMHDANTGDWVKASTSCAAQSVSVKPTFSQAGDEWFEQQAAVCRSSADFFVWFIHPLETDSGDSGTDTEVTNPDGSVLAVKTRTSSAGSIAAEGGTVEVAAPTAQELAALPPLPTTRGAAAVTFNLVRKDANGNEVSDFLPAGEYILVDLARDSPAFTQSDPITVYRLDDATGAWVDAKQDCIATGFSRSDVANEWVAETSSWRVKICHTSNYATGPGPKVFNSTSGAAVSVQIDLGNAASTAGDNFTIAFPESQATGLPALADSLLFFTIDHKDSHGVEQSDYTKKGEWITVEVSSDDFTQQQEIAIFRLDESKPKAVWVNAKDDCAHKPSPDLKPDQAASEWVNATATWRVKLCHTSTFGVAEAPESKPKPDKKSKGKASKAKPPSKKKASKADPKDPKDAKPSKVAPTKPDAKGKDAKEDAKKDTKSAKAKKLALGAGLGAAGVAIVMGGGAAVALRVRRRKLAAAAAAAADTNRLKMTQVTV